MSERAREFWVLVPMAFYVFGFMVMYAQGRSRTEQMGHLRRENAALKNLNALLIKERERWPDMGSGRADDDEERLN